MAISINQKTDLLLIVDVQNDFITGSLAVKNSDTIIPVINKYIKKIRRKVFSRDMHPENHVSFTDYGGQWPPHCVVGTPGAEFHPELDIHTGKSFIVNKGTLVDKDNYSAFDSTGLGMVLQGMNIKRIFVCGIATDYCVKATVLDALKLKGLQVYLLIDAIKAVNVNPDDGEAAINEMCVKNNAIPLTIDEIQ